MAYSIDLDKYKNIPDFTVISLASFEDISFIAELPVFLVFFGDEHSVNQMRELRKKHKFSHMTQTAEINNSVYDMRTAILRVLSENPFRSKRYAWIHPRVQSDVPIQCVSNILREIQVSDDADAFHAYITRGGTAENVVVSEKFFTFGQEIGKTVMGQFDGKSVLPLFTNEIRDRCVFSYGEDGDILDNFIKPVKNIFSIYHRIQIPFIDSGNNKEAYLCSQTILPDLLADSSVYNTEEFVDCIFKHYVAAYYIAPKDAIETVNIIRCLRVENEGFEKKYLENAGLYDSQIDYVKYL